ncbi:NADH-quinone oxidoreductase subunit A [Marinigracilibium pacificum]|uniref:NADH-quinone oxidoreductase subunit A n=1 Tax=Marinigracilibium pacificum TaxID=2729599 RepID=A0A848J583_9BACT|nr:NADH-quinone oxidoreductase subunit A [Marinigracilibium pacificum]NMM49624.1 NADH-quinone oxidoreductase subunit A [Marinigracilibium pacificum]
MAENIDLSNLSILLLFIVGGAVFTLGGVITSKIIRTDRPNPEKNTSYESGEDPVGNAWGQFNLRFYLVALMFLLFEVELIFLFPWATVFGDEQLIAQTGGRWGWLVWLEMVIFILILALGLAYAWRKGFITWEKPKKSIYLFKSPVPGRLYEEFNERMKDKEHGNKK